MCILKTLLKLVPPTINQQPGYQTPAFNHAVMGSSLSQYPGYSGMGGMSSGNLGLQRAPGPLIMQPSELGASGSAPNQTHSEGPPPSLQPSNVPIGPLSVDKEQGKLILQNLMLFCFLEVAEYFELARMHKIKLV